MTQTRTVRGRIVAIKYRHPENGWTVAQLKPNADEELSGQIGIVGVMPQIFDGDEVEIEGEFVKDPKFGWQIKVQRYLPLLPKTIEGIKRHLGSGLYPDIGPETAAKIVNHFGEDTLKILDDDPGIIQDVHGIGRKRAESFTENWPKLRKTREVSVLLATWGVTPGLSLKLIKHYGEGLIEFLRNDPYVLAKEIHGIGFKKADAIARGMGIQEGDHRRLTAAVKYSLDQADQRGHCFLTRSQLIDASHELTGMNTMPTINGMITHHDIKTDERQFIMDCDQACYSDRMLQMEQDAAFYVAEKLSEVPHHKGSFNLTELFSEGSDPQLSQTQYSAVELIMNSSLAILTGGPGTGKTTTLAAVLDAARRKKIHVQLAAPTGRAAKRMSEVTGRSARTIHRLLEFHPEVGFIRNRKNPLDGDLLVIDEASMVDLSLFYHLIQAVPEGMQVLFVGDPDQLPSVGPGNVLRDLINAGVPRVHLTEIFRQAAESMIIQNAHAINNGRSLVPTMENPNAKKDFYFFPNTDQGAIANMIIGTIKEKFAADVDIIRDVQVLAPMKNGECGVIKLNQRLQETLNPFTNSMDQLKHGFTTFRLGDRVMHIKNNYDLGVFNGDVGIITSINGGAEHPVEVTYDSDGFVEYKRSQLDELVLAYAATIHKSQGSEYPYVLLAFPMGPPMFYVRNLLYTAITRAKKLCAVFGNPKAIGMTINNNTVPLRNTQLCKRIKAGSKDETV